MTAWFKILVLHVNIHTHLKARVWIFLGKYFTFFTNVSLLHFRYCFAVQAVHMAHPHVAMAMMMMMTELQQWGGLRISIVCRQRRETVGVVINLHKRLEVLWSEGPACVGERLEPGHVVSGFGIEILNLPHLLYVEGEFLFAAEFFAERRLELGVLSLQ